ncbi:M23 family metallopeptidase [Candidatus Parcubacteria bacterium]|nr:M23 family metallopeptidase [Candidatus Parcubacteria bacterium]
MKNLFSTIFFLALIGIAGYFLYEKSIDNNPSKSEQNAANPAEQPIKEATDRIEKIEITKDSTYGALMATSGVPYELSTKIYDAAKPIYDLVKIRVGRTIELQHDKDTDEIKELRYKIDTEDELFVSRVATSSVASSSELNYSWQAELRPIPYELKLRIAAGTIETSMYQAALDSEIDIRAIIELANAFQWEIDFAMDPRVNDTFNFVYEERYLNGEYIMPGQIFAGRYVNAGEQFDVYYFEENEDNIGFFDADGNSVQKMFLKAPVAFKYISSGYTRGPRYLAAFQLFTSSHMAIDYAAAIGTPVRSVGNGTVIYAGWNNKGYGNYISVHHNGTYTTNYAHLSKIYVSYGKKVSQSDIIGAVGSTGFSTGPHLHYEMVKNGAKINPLLEVLPPGKPIKDENKDRFFAEIKKWQEMLDK